MVMWIWTAAYLAVMFTWLGGRPYLESLFPRRAKWLTEASAELHPFMPFAYLANLAIATWGEPLGDRWMSFATTGIALAGWFADRNDDDRWKRRRKKLTEKVAVSAGRLVVVGGDG